MAIQPITAGNRMFDVVSDLTQSGATALPTPSVTERDTTCLSCFVPVEVFTGDCPPLPRERRPSSLAIDISLPFPAHTMVSRRRSLEFSPTSPVYNLGLSSSSTFIGDSD
jgi:ATP-binding cassette, subfamily B (MDR/TAP), member 1